MQKSARKLFTSRTLTLASTLIIASYVVFGAATAESSWWQKGVDLLKSPAATTAPQALSTEDIGAGLKEALLVGSENVVSQLGALDGFNLDPAIHIPLPQQLDNVKSLLEKVGLSSMLDDLELKLNRAAEIATPKAKALFSQAISDMTFDDAIIWRWKKRLSAGIP